MANKDLAPQQKGKQDMAGKREAQHPLLSLQREMNRLFDNFFSGFDPFPLHAWEGSLQGYTPRVDISEDAKALHVAAELPGMDEKDVEVTLTQDALTLKGQKSEESEQKNKNYYRMERSYGAFQRVVPLPANIDTSKAEATFKKGILKITLPKTGDTRRDVKKIAVKSQ